MPRRLVLFLLFAFFSLVSSAQRQQPAAPPQTPRQALIEIVTKGAEGITKHLTVEVQELIAKSNNKAALAVLGGFSSARPQGLQTFDSGPVLFTFTEQQMKFEVRVENDDLAGDRDDLQLSLHSFRDGLEQEVDFGWMKPSRFIVSLKQQQGLWRLDKISVAAEFPFGDPAFFEKTFLKAADARAAGLSTVSGGIATSDVKANNEAPPAMHPEQLLMMLGFAETSFARQHPDKGFTCSLGELAEESKNMGIDGQLSSGVVGGYRIRLTGCEGRPAGSYQIIAEPVAGRGLKAFCVDATQNVRFSEDGQGSTCLAFGKVSGFISDEGLEDVHHSELVVHTVREK